MIILIDNPIDNSNSVMRPSVVQEYKQGMDLQIKQDGSDETMRAAASTMCYNYLKLVELQRWHKETEGNTMGTCSNR